MPDPLHHIEKRKHIAQSLAPYPHPEAHGRVIDRLVYFAGLLVPFMTAHQAYTIWITKNATGIAILTWIGFVCANIIWLTYGIVHRVKPIILTHTLLIIFNSSVAIGALLYG